jgi:hypothetical protein
MENHWTDLSANSTDDYIDTASHSPHSFAREARETSKEAPSEGSYMMEPAGWNTFNGCTTGEDVNWTMVDPVDLQFSDAHNPAEIVDHIQVPWNPEHPQHGNFEVDAGNSAFIPNPEYQYNIFKYQEGPFRESSPVRPNFGPQGSFLIREIEEDRKEQQPQLDMVPRGHDIESPEEQSEPHEHVFSIASGSGTPENRGRKRKLTTAERERTLEVRKYGACWACHLSKTKVCHVLTMTPYW